MLTAMSRKKALMSQNAYFHVCNKSIEQFRIFEHDANVQYFLTALDHYRQLHLSKISLSRALLCNKYVSVPLLQSVSGPVSILAYCIMPTHYHLLLKAPEMSFISRYIGVIENSYTRYFNRKHNRVGPLWQSRFNKILIESNSELLHVMRYIHLNPTSAGLTDAPEDWRFSSYQDLLLNPSYLKSTPEISIKSIGELQRFTNNQIAYQRNLQRLKKHNL